MMEIYTFSLKPTSDMERRRFITNLSAALLLLNGQTLQAADHLFNGRKRKLVRFVIGSDSHYGQKQTPYREYLETAVSKISAQHQLAPFDFAVINGDIVHDDISYFGEAKAILDTLPVTYYVTQGNHDMATPQQWEAAWNRPVNFDIRRGEVAMLFATTSNVKGEYLPPDLNWLESKFREYQGTRHILLFIHIPPVKFTANAIESKAFIDLVGRQTNLRAVFHGHEHDKDSIIWHNNIPYIFDGHIGGSWGVQYRGFRVVELYSDGALMTYMMDPAKKINSELINTNQ
ncbi:MAG TPA: metallophosphoesterase [Chitinophagaceae bacterium]|nr:metallophosphoesterase [Chitinophagaceae bacterium]